jgi:hypothetical protein
MPSIHGTLSIYKKWSVIYFSTAEFLSDKENISGGWLVDFQIRMGLK